MKQLISQEKIDAAAKELVDKTYPRLNDYEDWEDDGFDEGYNAAGNRSFRYGFNNGVQFAITEIEPLMVEFANLTSDYICHWVKGENMWLSKSDYTTFYTTKQLLEKFINDKNNDDETD